ncbi:MAG: aminopeptidase P family N-terminal domain-containing protein, partial [Streptosporangiaceae bacterium]
MSEIYRRRRAALAAVLGPEAALITRPVNVRYLTGLASSNAAVLVYGDGREAVLCTDARYRGTAARLCTDLEIVVERAVARVLTDRAGREGVRTLGFEGHGLTWEQHQELYGSPGRLQAVPLSREVEDLRMVKDEAEITMLRRACAI